MSGGEQYNEFSYLSLMRPLILHVIFVRVICFRMVLIVVSNKDVSLE